MIDRIMGVRASLKERSSKSWKKAVNSRNPALKVDIKCYREPSLAEVYRKLSGDNFSLGDGN